MLHGDRPERGERGGLMEHSFGEVGAHADPLPLASPERTLLVPDGIGHPQATEPWTRPARPSVLTSVCGQPDVAPAAGGQHRHGTGRGRACTAT